MKTLAKVLLFFSIVIALSGCATVYRTHHDRTPVYYGSSGWYGHKHPYYGYYNYYPYSYRYHNFSWYGDSRHHGRHGGYHR